MVRAHMTEAASISLVFAWTWTFKSTRASIVGCCAPFVWTFGIGNVSLDRSFPLLPTITKHAQCTFLFLSFLWAAGPPLRCTTWTRGMLSVYATSMGVLAAAAWKGLPL